MTTATEAFRAEMARRGLEYAGPLLPDGKLHRFKAEGDKERNSWFVLHAGPPPFGAYGCWRLGIKETWCERNGKGYSQAEWDAARKRLRETERERERYEAECQAKARKTAAWILSRAKPVTSHPYLTVKGVPTHGELRLSYHGELVLPLRDETGILHSLQFIAPDKRYEGERNKTYLRSGRVQGCYFALAEKPDGPLLIAEGYATAASVHEATAYATFAAMDCGNLVAVAQALRAKWPEREIILAADNDQWTKDNPGLTKAKEAAKITHARLAVPIFKDGATKPTDFNDLANLEGIAAVKEQIDKAEVPKETDDEAIARLAALPLLEYERCREKVAEQLGIKRVAILDKLVEAKRPKNECKDAAQGKTVDLPNVEPWDEPVDGALVLDEVSLRFELYLALPDGAADAMTLWVAHAHCFEAFEHTPRLNLCSPDKGCGKTTALDVLATLTPRPLRTESITAAVLFRLVEGHKPTLLLDEVDCYLDEAEELRGLLNAGHKRGARALRCEGESNTVRGFAAFAPAALAGIGDLPGTLHDRTIRVQLVRAKPGEVRQRFDSRHTTVEAELCRKLARWRADNFERVKACDPNLPETAYNRLADNWRPLFAIAEVAGSDWPRRAREAFVNLVGTDDMSAQGIGAMLLADIAGIFGTTGTDRLPSTKLAEALAAMEGRPWAEWGKNPKPISPNQLANQLRKFSIAPKTVRLGSETAKGYYLADFQDAFDRFLARTPIPDRNTVTTPVNIDDSADSEPSQQEGLLRPGNAEIVNSDGRCDCMTVQKPLVAENEHSQTEMVL